MCLIAGYNVQPSLDQWVQVHLPIGPHVELQPTASYRMQYAKFHFVLRHLL